MHINTTCSIGDKSLELVICICMIEVDYLLGEKKGEGEHFRKNRGK